MFLLFLDFGTTFSPEWPLIFDHHVSPSNLAKSRYPPWDPIYGSPLQFIAVTMPIVPRVPRSVWLVLHMCAMQCSAFRGPLLLPAARPGGRGLRVQRIQPKCIAAGEGAGEGALGRRVLLVAAVLSVAGGSTATECNAAGGGDNPRSLTTQGMELFKEAKVAASELHTSARTKSYVVCFPRVAQTNHRLFLCPLLLTCVGFV